MDRKMNFCLNHLSAIVLPGTLALAVGILLPISQAVVFAEQSLPTMAVGYLSGKITGIYQANLQIDGKTFSLAPECVLVDRHGDPLMPDALKEDVEVKYHLLKGSTDKIDSMVVFLPY